MRVMFLKTYGVFEGGKVYDLPLETAEQMIVMGIAVKSTADSVPPNKAMKPERILKGGL